MILNRKFFINSVLALVVAGSLSGEPAFGDWLVTRDGVRVETRGTWQVKGKLVVFHSAAGVLSSLRLDAVDLEASAAQTEAAGRANAAPEPPAEPAPKPKARFVVTDADVGHVDPETFKSRAARDEVDGEVSEAEPAAEPAEAGPNGSTSSAGPSESKGKFAGSEDNPLEILAWDAVLKEGGAGVEITGTLRNPSDSMATGTKLTVAVLDFNREVIGERKATLAKTSIGPGKQVVFRVSFPGVFAVSDARFEATSFNAVVRKPG